MPVPNTGPLPTQLWGQPSAPMPGQMSAPMAAQMPPQIGGYMPAQFAAQASAQMAGQQPSPRMGYTPVPMTGQALAQMAFPQEWALLVLLLPLLAFLLGGVAEAFVPGASAVETAKRAGKVLGAALLGVCGFLVLVTMQDR